MWYIFNATYRGRAPRTAATCYEPGGGPRLQECEPLKLARLGRRLEQLTAENKRLRTFLASIAVVAAASGVLPINQLQDAAGVSVDSAVQVDGTQDLGTLA